MGLRALAVGQRRRYGYVGTGGQAQFATLKMMMHIYWSARSELCTVLRVVRGMGDDGSDMVCL
jgi:hypothetical protein